ncbi:hypothetical protein NHX12_024090 [Muraenolepis orangiensis]|uniref:Small EDRK-rich factor-like N-terminal domain-containing protein n=1 Tax=Muraenolepis orangiensis TaxID=630683 RepID=A0A9Q0ELI0_9TELE|nr:hypothetical protein NHX12_024090 [Muraenolepis orangiensis]
MGPGAGRAPPRPTKQVLAQPPGMARGHQKVQSQQKNAKKQAEMKKAKGHDQKTAAKAALVFTCLVCKCRNEKVKRDSGVRGVARRSSVALAAPDVIGPSLSLLLIL